MTTAFYGDAQLATRLSELLGKRHRVAAVAVVRAGECLVASRGAHLAADFEIGSISKGVTGLLYADSLSRGEVESNTTLGDILPLGDSPVAKLTLASLSTHHSGLPSLPRAAHPLRRTIALWRHGTNPYGERVSELLTQARTVNTGASRGSYSNLGYELLGHAIATAASTTYAELLNRRLTSLLGLPHTYVPARAEQLRDDALVGRSRGGRTQQPWTGEAFGPAGGIRSTIGDMARLTAALLDESAPGVTALDPVAELGRGARIGAAWITLEFGGRAITWHNGRTGGFSSWLGVDREAGTGVVLLSATSASIDRHGFSLLAEHGKIVRG